MRVGSPIKYISSMRDFIKNQVRHDKSRVISRNSKMWEEKNDSRREEKIVGNISRLSQGKSTKKVKTAQNTLTPRIREWERLLPAQPED